MFVIELGADMLGATGDEDTTPVRGSVGSITRAIPAMSGVERETPSLTSIRRTVPSLTGVAP